MIRVVKLGRNKRTEKKQKATKTTEKAEW